VQRIKSQGDYSAAKLLVESYGVKVDQVIHQEVIRRYTSLGVAPYSGFLNPKLSPVKSEDGTITDVEVSYTEGFLEQMIRYNTAYGFLVD